MPGGADAQRDWRTARRAFYAEKSAANLAGLLKARDMGQYALLPLSHNAFVDLLVTADADELRPADAPQAAARPSGRFEQPPAQQQSTTRELRSARGLPGQLPPPALARIEQQAAAPPVAAAAASGKRPRGSPQTQLREDAARPAKARKQGGSQQAAQTLRAAGRAAAGVHDSSDPKRKGHQAAK